MEKEMTTHSSIFAWEIPRTEEPGGLQSMGSQRAGHDSVSKHKSKPVQATGLTQAHAHKKGHVEVQSYGAHLQTVLQTLKRAMRAC